MVPLPFQILKKLQLNKHNWKNDSEVLTYQNNTEGFIIDRIHEARRQGVGFIVINAGAYTHTSVGIRDALLGTAIPFIEVHITNVHQREPFRHQSYLSDKAVAVICGLGVYGYTAAIEYALNYWVENLYVVFEIHNVRCTRII